jgi:hypothetical protein
MSMSISLRLKVGVVAAFLCAGASAAEVFVLGPVEKISSDGYRITVLGQSFTIDRQNALGRQVKNRDQSAEFSVGSYVYLVGERSIDGVLVADSGSVVKAPYVAGASEVFLSGIVSKYDQKLGVVTIGSAEIYIPGAAVESTTAIRVGADLRISGYQFNPSSQVLATQIQGMESISIQGTGIQSIQGTGAESLSIQGTGKQSIQGTGVQSIQGTGAEALSIQGTGVQSIQGTGAEALSIQGTGKQSIQGTGVQSIQGTGAEALSIQGTGKLSIQSTGVQSIQGTGAEVLSIQGTGKQSIQGTGVQSIQGTGAAIA